VVDNYSVGSNRLGQGQVLDTVFDFLAVGVVALVVVGVVALVVVAVFAEPNIGF